jgi:pimeloyl-ACP methyl ester carboxylesterase
MRWLRIAALSLLGLLALLILTGFVYERVERTRDAHRVSPQIGRSYAVNGHSMNIYCSGAGSPTVVFEAGGNAPGYAWTPVQPQIAQFTRACWYDRAGVGWSGPPAEVRTSTNMAADLHELLRAAGEHPPYVFVGASVGGEYSRIYAGHYPDEVAGMVLVDSSHPDQREPQFMLGPMNRMSVRQRRFMCDAFPWMVNLGIMRKLIRRPRSAHRPGFTDEQAMLLSILQSQPPAFRAQSDQTCAATHGGEIVEDGGTGNPEVDDATRRAGSLGDRPLVVLTAGKYDTPDDPAEARQAAEFQDIWIHHYQADLARLSTRGKQIVVDKADHGIADEAPEVVIDAVHSVVEQVRDLNRRAETKR